MPREMPNDDNWAEIKRRQREQQQRQRDEINERAAKSAAAEEAVRKAFNDRQDREFADAFKELLGYSPEDVQKYVMQSDDKKVGRLLGDIQKAGKAGKNAKARKLIKKNRAAIKAAAKEGKKKGSGCAVVGLLLLGAASAVGYGVVQGVSAVAGALW